MNSKWDSNPDTYAVKVKDVITSFPYYFTQNHS